VPSHLDRRIACGDRKREDRRNDGGTDPATVWHVLAHHHEYGVR
jgi:hypothetical protein